MKTGTLWGREPALIIAAIQALLALGVGFGLRVTPEQMALILAAAAAVLGVITRQQVTPNGSVAARVDDAPPPPDVVAGPAADVPEGVPVQVEPLNPIVSSEGVTYPQSSDAKSDAAHYDPKHDAP